MRTVRPRRWTLAVALAVAATALGALVLPPVVPGGGDGDDSSRTGPQAVLSGGKVKEKVLRVATFNTAATLGARAAAQDVVGVVRKGRPHVLALQEMGNPDRRALVRRALVGCTRCAYRAFVPGSAVPASTPILWREGRLELVRPFSRQVTSATRVGPRGAGPAVIRAKYVNGVHLRDRLTGRHVYVLNNHTVPTVQTGEGLPNKRLPARLGIYRKHMQGLQEIVSRLRRTGAAVLVVGDLNVNYRSDRRTRPRLFPYTRLGAVGMRSSFEARLPRRGTHVLRRSGGSQRLIDYVYVMRRRGSPALDNRIMGGFRSDHRPVVVTLLVRAR